MMFVCLEGIDGAGKTTVAGELVCLLEAAGRPVRLLEHNAVRVGDPFVDPYLDSLRGLWRTSLGGPFFKLGDLHWVLAKASYYAIVDHCAIAPALAAGQIVLADGWFYKFAARIASNNSLSLPEILQYFNGVRTADRTFLIDMDPRQAAARLGGDFNNGELGPMNIGTARPAAAFIAYQSAVRDHLTVMAKDYGWTVVSGSDGTPRDVACLLFECLRDGRRVSDGRHVTLKQEDA